MAFDDVPWLIDGGAVHSAEVTRTLAYAALGGAQGIVESPDLKVTALDTPVGQVRIAAGACGILNTYPDQTRQSYVGRNTSDTLVTIAPTSGTARSDAVVVRIDDPQYGGSAPLPGGPFIYPTVVSNVASSVTRIEQLGLAYPAILLARIDVPVSTSAITNAMIKDMRRVISPRSQRRLVVVQPAVLNELTATTPTMVQFPNESVGIFPNVDIPTWATQAIIGLNVGGMLFNGPEGTGAMRIKMGTDGNAKVTQNTNWDNTGAASATFRIAMIGGGTLDIPAAYRGTAQKFAIEATNGGGNAVSARRARLDAASTVIVDIEFIENPAVA